ncbi:hypothetical protein D5S18_04780 [Nocardia panacis]|uniref:Uncharacterized protein n=1 Tax=Nocardia panacis TaxID=2340916 RepID=A0A3A4KSA2_9NOCA|nr:hypothetical protein [Nocardia panacis]RJO78836.1 hypothetical protein D5S18_04780 [Nocardia panacis]
MDVLAAGPSDTAPARGARSIGAKVPRILLFSLLLPATILLLPRTPGTAALVGFPALGPYTPLLTLILLAVTAGWQLARISGARIGARIGGAAAVAALLGTAWIAGAHL